MIDSFERRTFSEDDLNNKENEKREATSPARKETTEPEYVLGTIQNANFVRVREAPNPKADVLDTLAAGSTLRISKKIKGDYRQVKLDDGRVGYVMSGFCEVNT